MVVILMIMVLFKYVCICLCPCVCVLGILISYMLAMVGYRTDQVSESENIRTGSLTDSIYCWSN
jgi:hypothetical protein